MAKEAPRGGGAKGSMVAFWLVIGAAALLLAAYLAKVGMSSPGGAGGPSRQANRSEAPAGEVRAIGGGSAADLRALRGKVVVLHFWATWCPPCRAEFPEFAHFAGSSKGEREVSVLPISLDQDPAAVEPFLSDIPERFPIYWDSGSLAQEFAVSSIPTTIVLDKEGRIAWRRQGAVDWSAKGVPKMVEALVRE